MMVSERRKVSARSRNSARLISVSGTRSSASRRNPAVANAWHACSAVGNVLSVRAVSGKNSQGNGVRRIGLARKSLADQHRGARAQHAADLPCGRFEVGDVVDHQRQPGAVRRAVRHGEGAGLPGEYPDARVQRDLGSHGRRRLDREDGEVEPVAERGGERAGPAPMSTTVIPGDGRRCRRTASRHAASPSRGTSRTARYAAAV
jgi:hypothetical protein